MQEGVLLVPDVHEGGVEAGCHFAHLGEVNVAYGEAALGPLAVQLREDLVLHEGNGYFACPWSG